MQGYYCFIKLNVWNKYGFIYIYILNYVFLRSVKRGLSVKIQYVVR